MKLKALFRLARKRLIGHNDPVKFCTLYRDEGCSHVDGLLCNFPKCGLFRSHHRKNL